MGLVGGVVNCCDLDDRGRRYEHDATFLAGVCTEIAEVREPSQL